MFAVKPILLILFFIVISLSVSANTAALTGIGFGATEDEAKKEALADLASAVRVRVYSKYERQETAKNGGEISSDVSKFTRLISDVPLINPAVSYFRENGKIKAIASLNNPESYANKLRDLSDKINILTDFQANAGRDLIYRQLEAAAPLYDEYENYETVLTVLGFSDYARPKISGYRARAMLLDMQSTPPSLEIAAEILIKPMRERTGIYVSAPRMQGSDNITPFAAFFKDILSAKLKASENKASATYNMACSYTESGGDVIMSCSLLSGSTVAASSIVKVPGHLVTGSVKLSQRNDLAAIINKYNNSASSSLKVSLKISADGDPSILNAGDSATLLVKSNKEAYIYIVRYTGTSANLMPIVRNGAFILRINKNQADKWISVGQFKISKTPGTETLQVFALENEPNPPDIFPDYIIENTKPEKAADDFMHLFMKQSGEKNVSVLSYAVIGGKK